MDNFGVLDLDLDPHENLCGSEKLELFSHWILVRIRIPMELVSWTCIIIYADPKC